MAPIPERPAPRHGLGPIAEIILAAFAGAMIVAALAAILSSVGL